MKVYNIGYQQKRINIFCEMLREAGVETLIDVRERAWSNRPEYRKQALRMALGSVGIEYIHLKSAGNPFRPKNGIAEDFAACKAAYTKHLKQNFGVVAEALSLAARTRSAFFCYEADRCGCHRDVLLREIAKSNATPVEIVDL